MKIYIIRHGETEANIGRYLQGITDGNLTENGRELARVTGRAMKGIRIDECFTSPLTRAKDTAALFLKESGNENTPVRVDDRLKEINVGDLEMKRMDELTDEQKRSYFLHPLDMPSMPGGETPRDVCQRTQEFLKELAARNDDKTYLVSTHGGALRSMLNFLYDDPSDYWQGGVPRNCSVSLVEVRDGKPVLSEKDRIWYDPEICPDYYSYGR